MKANRSSTVNPSTTSQDKSVEMPTSQSEATPTRMRFPVWLRNLSATAANLLSGPQP
jgi:hypothetical protein